MKKPLVNLMRSGVKWILFLSVHFLVPAILLKAESLQLISSSPSKSAAPAGGSGNSDLPIVSADGRYIVFASTAANLVTNTGPVSGLSPRRFQVFVRDHQTGVIALVSANVSGFPGDGDSFPSAISTNGQFVLFESAVDDLVNGDTNGQGDVFLRDVVNGTTELVSVNTNGFSGNGNSHNAVMTPDARFIAFSSAASDLVASDTNGISDVFVRDRQANTTALVSVGAISTGSNLLPSASDSPDISSDGRFVSFYTTATNLVPGDNTAGQIFVRDLSSATTLWASSNAPSLFLTVFGSANAISCNQRISADGNYIIFEACSNHSSAYVSDATASGLILRYNIQTGATDLISANAATPWIQYEDINTLDITSDGRFVAFVSATNIGSSHATCVNVRDAQSGALIWASTNLSGGISANDFCLSPKLDSSGRYVTFLASASNFTTNSVLGYNCYLHDMQNGMTTLVNADTNGTGSGVESLTPSEICDDGHFVVFVAGDGNLVANDNNKADDVFSHDVVANTTELISQHNPDQNDVSAGTSSGFSTIGVSSNAMFIAFASEASLVANDTNNLRDVYLRDVSIETNILISVNTNGVAADGISSEPSIDAVGRYVAFSSFADDLVAGDTNKSFDVFVRDTLTGATTLVSLGTNDIEGNGDSYAPTISADGRYVLFYSLANNFAAGTVLGYKNLFLRDLQVGTNYTLTFSGASHAAMTPDGHRVAFVDNSTAKLYVWDTLTAKRIYTNSIVSGLYTLTVPSLSSDGNFVAWFDNEFKAANLASNSLTVINSGSSSIRIGARFSGDNRFLVYSINTTNALDSNAAADIYVYDFQSGSNTLISRSVNSTAAANGAADSPAISADGRFIAYRTFANDNVATDLNGVPDLMLYDRSNSLSILITANAAGNRTGNNRSTAPIFSADGKNLIFTSWASDLVSHDFNRGDDVFILPLPGSSVTGSTNGAGGVTWISGLQMFQIPTASTAPAFSWPSQSGAFYQIQYKDDLTDPVWHSFTGSATISGNLGEAYDSNPSPDQRFYRVILGN